MDRLTHYRIVKEDADVELHEDLLVAMRRARRLAEREGTVYEIRDEHDFILVVVISSKVEDKGTTMPRAVRHNSKLTLARQRDVVVAQCPATEKQHDWKIEPPQHRLLFRCVACNVLGYQVGGMKTVAHRCTTCGGPATIERPRNMLRHRWSCEAHVDA